MPRLFVCYLNTDPAPQYVQDVNGNAYRFTSKLRNAKPMNVEEKTRFENYAEARWLPHASKLSPMTFDPVERVHQAIRAADMGDRITFADRGKLVDFYRAVVREAEAEAEIVGAIYPTKAFTVAVFRKLIDAANSKCFELSMTIDGIVAPDASLGNIRSATEWIEIDFWTEDEGVYTLRVDVSKVLDGFAPASGVPDSVKPIIRAARDEAVRIKNLMR